MLCAALFVLLAAGPAKVEAPTFVPGVFVRDSFRGEEELVLLSDGSFQFSRTKGDGHQGRTEGTWLAHGQNLISLTSHDLGSNSSVETFADGPVGQTSFPIEVLSAQGNPLPEARLSIQCGSSDDFRELVTDPQGRAVAEECKLTYICASARRHRVACVQETDNHWSRIRITLAEEQVVFEGKLYVWFDGELREVPPWGGLSRKQ